MTTLPVQWPPRRGRRSLAAATVGSLVLAGCHLGQPPTLYPLGDTNNFLADLAVGDVDADGDADLVAVLWGSYAVALNDGAGRFDVTRMASQHVRGGRAVLAEVTGDRRLDLVHHADGAGEADIRAGDGTGHFSAERTVLPSLDPLDTGVAVADLDGDGDGDVVAAGPAGLTVWSNLGAGSFGEPSAVSVRYRADSLAVADLNADDVPDLVVGSQASPGNAVLVVYGDGRGGFSAPEEFPSGLTDDTRRIYVAAADLDGDGVTDVFGGNSATADLFVLTGDGEGGLGAPAVYDGLAPSGGVTAADVDGDGRLDAVTDAAVLYSDGGYGLTDVHDVAGGQRVVSADFDGNGEADLAYLTTDSLAVLLNTMEGRRGRRDPIPDLGTAWRPGT